MDNTFRKRLLNRELLIGTMVTIPSPEVAELFSLSGFDWLFIDAEHSPFSVKNLQAVLQSAGSQFPCLIRIISGREEYIKQSLDLGAAGIIVPQVNSKEQAEAVVQASRYSPGGSRGIGIGRAQNYGFTFQEYIATANEKLVVVIQIEDIRAVEKIDSILKVDGIDAILVGPYDLSASMGKIGKPNDPEVVSAVKKVVNACKKLQKPMGIFGLSSDVLIKHINEGFTLIVAGLDTQFLINGARNILSDLRSSQEE